MQAVIYQAPSSYELVNFLYDSEEYEDAPLALDKLKGTDLAKVEGMEQSLTRWASVSSSPTRSVQSPVLAKWAMILMIIWRSRLAGRVQRRLG